MPEERRYSGTSKEEFIAILRRPVTPPDRESDRIIEMVNRVERDIEGRLSEMAAKTLREIERCGSQVGPRICEECEESIPQARLAALPWATCCRPCQEKLEAKEGRYAPR